MSALRIRSATAEDSSAIAAVVRESWLDANKNLIPADSQRALTNSRNLAAFVAGEWQSIHVAEFGDEIVGAVGVNAAGVIWMLYVLPAYQGCGVGSALYDAAIGAIKSAGQRKAMLEVLAANENAVAFYRARGWVPEGRRTEHIPGFRFTALRMGLALA
ncbi:MAG: N-acetyltransferase family protein [Rhodospirillaceae bacterium]